MVSWCPQYMLGEVVINMTTIVGIVDEKDGTVWMGSDSQVTSGWVSQEMSSSKVFILNGRTQLLVGVAGMPRVAQILEHYIETPEHLQDAISDEKYIVQSIISLMRKALADHGVLETKEGVEDHKGEFMIGYRGKLYSVDGRFSVGHYADNFEAIGSGREFALAALDTALSEGATPKDAIYQALTTAAKFDLGTGGKLWLSRMDKQGVIAHE